MSVMIPRFSGFPPELFEKGIAPKVSNTGLRLYIFLCRHSDRKSSRQFAVSDKEISQHTGASVRALRDARINLTTLGLVVCQRSPGDAYLYSLCDPNTGRPYPGDPKTRLQYTKRDRLSPPKRSNAHGLSATTSAIHEEPSSLESDDSDTSFDYGCNASDSKVYFHKDAFM